MEKELGLTLQRAFEILTRSPWLRPPSARYTRPCCRGRKVVVKVRDPGRRQVKKDVDLLMQFAEFVEGRIIPMVSTVDLVREFSALSIGSWTTFSRRGTPSASPTISPMTSPWLYRQCTRGIAPPGFSPWSASRGRP